MADTTMEVDAAPQLGFEDHLEDDLITYDENIAPDTVEHSHTVEENIAHDPATNGFSEDPEAIYQDSREADTNKPHAAMAEAGEDHTIAHDEPIEGGAQPEVDFFETEADENLDDAGQGESARVDEEQDLSHEIDYDEGEEETEDRSTEDHLAGLATAPEQGSEEQTHGAEPSQELEAEKDVGEGVESHHEQHEISWEHDEGDQNEDDAPTNDEAAMIDSMVGLTAAHDGQDPHHVEQDDTDGHQGASAEEAAEEDLGGTAKPHATSTELSQHEQDDISHDDDSHAAETTFPAITVHYKGDEFPFFSLSSEGFFSQASVLDDNMQRVLEGFRAELNNELLPQDDLVFQVDELGLEFAESSSVDALSNITLRQVLEVFDILVKNQDPESTRTLYTYLFTRPSTNKRFEYLMESATEGKGLDEVIHLFDSPMGRGPGIAETATGNDDFDTQPDDIDSADGQEDESAANEEESGSHDDTDDSDVLDAYDAGVDDGEGLQHFDDAAASAARADDEDDQQGEKEEELQQTFLTTDVNDYQEEDADAFLTGDFDESADVVENDLEGVDAGDFTNLGTNPTSTTTTVKEDGDTTPALDDVGIVETEHNELTLDDVVEPDDLDEIDWRDPEVPDEGAGGDSSSTATKRARGDDDAAADEEQDAKRQKA